MNAALGPDACCVACENEKRSTMTGIAKFLNRPFIVCPECGNKRCPKAQQHDRTCTRSNATGQPGGG